MDETAKQDEISVDSLLNGPCGFKYKGNDNYGKPKIEYLQKIIAMDENQLQKETEQAIWLSAYANNNGRSDYHWQCDACYDVSKKFGDLYTRAYNAAKSRMA